MWAAQPRAPLPTRYVSSSPETSVPPGTCWSPCALEPRSLRPCALRSSTQPASTSLARLRVGGGRSFTLANCGSAGESWRTFDGVRKQAGRRFILPLVFELFSSIRFRWYQGFFSSGSAPPTWALDNVYIGPQCQDMCNGHGSCVGGSHCVCDPGYAGADCSVPEIPNTDFLKEDFEGGPLNRTTSLYMSVIMNYRFKNECLTFLTNINHPLVINAALELTHYG